MVDTVRRLKNLDEDQVFNDLILFARKSLGTAAHDALLRFKWAEYGYSEGVAAISLVLCHLLATVNRQINISPEEMGALVKDALITVRKNDDDDDDDEND